MLKEEQQKRVEEIRNKPYGREYPPDAISFLLSMIDSLQAELDKPTLLEKMLASGMELAVHDEWRISYNKYEEDCGCIFEVRMENSRHFKTFPELQSHLEQLLEEKK